MAAMFVEPRRSALSQLGEGNGRADLPFRRWIKECNGPRDVPLERPTARSSGGRIVEEARERALGGSWPSGRMFLLLVDPRCRCMLLLVVVVVVVVVLMYTPCGSWRWELWAEVWGSLGWERASEVRRRRAAGGGRAWEAAAEAGKMVLRRLLSPSWLRG